MFEINHLLPIARFGKTSMLVKCILLLAVLIPSMGNAGVNDKNYGRVLVESVTSIYDGDTFRVNIKGWPSIVGEHIPIRIMGIDTPELRGKCQAEKSLARQAKQHTVAMLREAQKIELYDVKRGKYFRLLATVYVDGKSLGDSLIKEGLAVTYGGGTKKNWCDD